MTLNVNSALSIVEDDLSNVVDVENRKQHNNEYIKFFNQFLEDNKRDKSFVIDQVARAMDETPNRVKLYLCKKYLGDKKEFENKFISVVERLNDLLDPSKDSLRFSDKTISAKTCIGVFNGSLRKRIFSGVLGKPGLGKTTAAKHFARNNDVLYVSLNRTDFSMIALLTKLLEELGLPKYNKVHNKILNEIVDYLLSENKMIYNEELDKFVSPPKLIIVDQSNYLSLDAVDVLRTIAEEANVGLCFLGLPSFTKKLDSKRSEIKQLKDRISLLIELDEPTYEDICLVIDLNWPGLSDELKKEFFKFSRKTYRLLSHLISHCREDLYCEENLGNELTVQHIREAAGYLPKASDEEE